MLDRILDAEAAGPWFEAATPKLVAIAEATQAVDRLVAVWATNFPAP